SFANASFGLPESPNIRSGDVSFSNPDTSTLNIHQGTQKAIIDWNQFSIASPETVNFMQPSQTSVALNRVTGGSISEIFGALNANGEVWLINPNGIVFGANSRINAAGFMASTLNINDQDFLNGSWNFNKSSQVDGYIINKGSLAVKDGGYIALLSDVVRNEGVIEARLGKVVLASGEKITVELDSEGTVSVAIDDLVDDSDFRAENSIMNKGVILADGGTVNLTAGVLNGIFENAVNNEGIIRANSLVNKNGAVYLIAHGEDALVANSGTIDVSATESGADGGFVELSADRLNIGGDIRVDSIDGQAGELLLDPINLYILNQSPGDDNLGSTVGEAWLENFNGNITLQADSDVYFLIGDDQLNLQFFDTETFRVEAGNNIVLNDDSITTQGGNIELISDYLVGVSDGNGDLLLGIGNTITTNGGNVLLNGANINVSSPINTGGGNVDIVASKNVTHGSNGDVTTSGGDFVGFASGDYNFRLDSSVDTQGGALNVGAGGDLVLGSDTNQVEYTWSWEYDYPLSGWRTFHFKELGYYYIDNSTGSPVLVPLVKGFDIGKDGNPRISGAGVIYGDIGEILKLYTTSIGNKEGILTFYQDPHLNADGMNHVIIDGSKYHWEDIHKLGDRDYDDEVIDFTFTRKIFKPIIPPPPVSTPEVQAIRALFWDMRFKIPKKHFTEDLQITYTKGPIELVAEQIFFYHPLIEMDMYEMPALEEEFYDFIGGQILHNRPMLLQGAVEGQ
ncbi:filamentous hemagglutinin N-terminal domain-containing protein, partial [Candidatus Omnitrophota bacterium]